MTPTTLALLFQVLQLVITEAPEMVTLIKQIEADFGKHPTVQQTLKQITDGTIKVSAATLAQLAPLVNGKVV